MTMETIGKLDSECATLQEENLKLQSEFHSLWSVKMHDNFVPKRYVRFTGLLHIEILKAVFEFVSPYVPASQFAIPPFQQSIMVLMKLLLANP